MEGGKGNGCIPLPRCKHGVAGPHACILTALTKSSLASSAAPSPLPTHHCCLGCLSYSMRGAPCNCGGHTNWPVQRCFAQARYETLRSPPPVPPLVSKTPQQTNKAPNCTLRAQEEAQRGSYRSGTSHPCALFAKPRPPPRGAKSAHSSHHCRMTQLRIFTQIRQFQKRRKNLVHLDHLEQASGAGREPPVRFPNKKTV